MLRKKIAVAFQHEKFRHRGHEIARIETLSDAVFAFSVSLLVASLEVPQTFEELRTIVRGALPFFATVALLFLFWYQQYMFFRRYGLNDFLTILLNLMYLGIILFYVYPLKFLFSILLTSWTGINLFPRATEKGLIVLTQNDFPELIVLFSTGYFIIWMIIYFMYKRAFYFARQLELNHYELLFTHKEIKGALWNAMVGLLAIILAWAGTERLAGICYLSIPVILIINDLSFKHQVKKMVK
ncbi:MAG: TMEM175 family protein [Bacteroidota bacterium]|nr:TMEM175 family protein [Bacteroidota bacterium]